jgi:hypothetical protein
MFGEAAALMVASEQEDLVREVDLHGQEVEEAFEGEVSPINVVAEEEESVQRRFTSGNLKDLQQIIKLSMDISNDYEKIDIAIRIICWHTDYGDGHVDQVGLLLEQVPAHLQKAQHLFIRQFALFKEVIPQLLHIHNIPSTVILHKELLVLQKAPANISHLYKMSFILIRVLCTCDLTVDGGDLGSISQLVGELGH